MRPDEIEHILSVIADIGDIPFEPGEARILCLGLSDGSEVVIETDPEGDSLLLSASLFSVPNQDRQAVLMRAMELNYLNQGTSGATLGWNPADGFLVISALIPLRLIDEAGFVSALNAFCNQVMAFRTGLPDLEATQSGRDASRFTATPLDGQQGDAPITFIRG